jgi:hypothetical protein
MHSPKSKSIVFIFASMIAISTKAQIFPTFEGAVYSNVSTEHNLLYGGYSNRVYLELSSIKADSIRIVPAHPGTIVTRDSGNWFTITPPPYEETKKKTDQYDSLQQKFMDDLNLMYDSAFMKQFRAVESYTVTERKNKYSTYLSIIALNKNGKKFETIKSHRISFEVIPATYYVFSTLNGYTSGENITAEQLFSNAELRTQTIFEDQQKLNPPNRSETYTVVSFSVAWDNEEGDILEVNVQGNRLNAPALAGLRQSVKPGTVITFQNIRVKGDTSGKIQKVPSLLYIIK